MTKQEAKRTDLDHLMGPPSLSRARSVALSLSLLLFEISILDLRRTPMPLHGSLVHHLLDMLLPPTTDVFRSPEQKRTLSSV